MFKINVKQSEEKKWKSYYAAFLQYNFVNF